SFLTAARHDNAAAFFCESDRRRSANSAQRPGDQHDGFIHFIAPSATLRPHCGGRLLAVPLEADLGLPRIPGKDFVRSRPYFVSMAIGYGATASSLLRGRRRGGERHARGAEPAAYRTAVPQSPVA